MTSKKTPRQQQPQRTKPNALLPRDQGTPVHAGNTDLQDVKVTISIRLDGDIIEFFKQRAAVPGAAPYQTQINDALRSVMILTTKK
jgi:uncharacterized protein (DUF4415 family)